MINSALFQLRRVFGVLTGWALLPTWWCGRCHVSWRLTEHHLTPYDEGGGCFPLCEWCWSRLTPAERRPYYERLMAHWVSQCRSARELEDVWKKRPSIIAAVDAGL